MFFEVNDDNGVTLAKGTFTGHDTLLVIVEESDREYPTNFIANLVTLAWEGRF